MKRLLTAFVIITLIVLSACGRPSDGGNATGSNDEGEGSYKIRIAHLVAEDASGHIAAETFKKNIEERTDGKVTVELYPNGQLYGSDREAIEAVQLGNLEMTLAALAPIVSFNDKFMVFDLPFLFDSKEAVYEVLDGELGQSLLDELEKDSIKGLVFVENGFRHITNNVRPIETLEDMEGLKMRTLESPLHTDIFKAFGTNASPFAYGELYTALQQGTYDAMENPIPLVYLSKFYEVQKYLTLSNHVYAPGVFLANNDYFNSFPEDIQTIIMEEAENMRDEQRKLSTEQEEEFLRVLESEGMKINELSDEQKELFREAVQPVYDKYVPKIGEDIVNEALEANK